MEKYSSLLLTLFLLTASADYSVAQFEGKVVYNSYEVESNGEQTNSDSFTMFVTADRILLQGDDSYDFMGDIKTEGVLIRLDHEDFVFLTGDDKALQISKADITSMINMFGGEENSNDSSTDFGYEKTNESKKINGYDCEKFIFSEDDEENDFAEVWMTRDLKINWGMLAEPWGEQAEGMIGGSFPITLIFEDGYFPIRIDSYKSGKLNMVTEAEQINPSSIARAMVQIPSGVSVLSFQDYLFQKLGEQ